MASASSYTVRPATEADAAQINAIVNHEIGVSVNNFNYGPRSEADGLLWLKSTLAGYPVLVAVTTVDGKEVIGGYASLGSFRQKDGYRFTAEYSLYIHQEHRRRGLGRTLLRDLLVEAKARGFHAIIGSISEGNEASLRLAAEFGFRVVGTMKENGFKFDRWIDNTFVELLL
ncbi:L-amino acid N-acyltransferase [Entomortierella parvispora]|uniref:L-amino acid N-acyltransferase n=1 Tax=Entomortierella parvispora TaxID=205924 RepID=A0A9P3M1G0_9FUNG|nr:L-amino acid N-acyltransferase [Entomortierella parvispora]